MKVPLLSIIIVSYRDSFLILNQTLQLFEGIEDYELFLVDANEKGSACSKGLAEDMENYPDIPLLRSEWEIRDLAAARNAGAARTRGTYLTFLTTHDIWNQRGAEKQIEVLEADPHVGLSFGCGWEPAVSSVSQVIFRRAVFEELLGFDTRLHGNEEFDIWRRISDRYQIVSVDSNLISGIVKKGVLKDSRGLVDVVGYLQLYSRNRNMYRRNTKARAELYRKMACCYREKKRFLSWMDYTVRSRILMRGKKSDGEIRKRFAENTLTGFQEEPPERIPEPFPKDIPADFPETPAEKTPEIFLRNIGVSKENASDIGTERNRESEEKFPKGRIRISKKKRVFSKVSVEDNFQKDRTGVPLGGPRIYIPCLCSMPEAGAEFEIIAEEDIFTKEGTLCFARGSVVQKLTTGEDGIAVSRELSCGRYKVREIGSVYGSLCSPKARYAEIGCRNEKTDRTNTDVEFSGEWPQTYIHVRKGISETPVWERNRRNRFEDFLFGLFAAEDIYLSDDAMIPCGGLIRTFRCGEDGEGCISAELPYGNYFVRELLSGSCYKRQERDYLVCFAGEDAKNGEVHLYINEGNEIESEMTRGKICGRVKDQGGSPIAGAEIGLFLMETTMFSRENAVLKAAADKNGVFSFLEVPCGDYIIRETGMPRGYEPEKKAQIVSLVLDRQCVWRDLDGRKMKEEEEEENEN